MKQFFFLQSLPRCGNTLLSSIINKNKNIKITSNSIVSEILFQIKILKNNEVYKNFPDEKSFNNVYKNIFNLYYKDWESEYIIDRGPWGTPFNLNILKEIFSERKFIVVHRPILECLASFVKIKNPLDNDDYCDYLMNQKGIIGKYLLGINNLIKEKENLFIIDYKNLIKNLENEIKNIFTFLNIKNFTIDTEKLNQFSINDVYYDDSIYNCDFHTIRTDKIEYIEIDINRYLSKNIIKKYSNYYI